MKWLIMLCFFIISTQLYAQKIITIPSNKGDTSYWYHWSENLNNKLGLPDLKTTSNEYYFRVTYIEPTVYTIIDFFRIKDSTYKAIVTFYTKKCNSNNEKKIIEKVFVKKIEINSINSFNVYKLISSLNIGSIPSEEYIKGWSQGFDGVVYLFEFSDSKSYELKSYWTPSIQGSLKEAQTILKFIQQLAEKINLPSLEKQFSNEIPFNCYSADGSMAVIRVKNTKK